MDLDNGSLALDVVVIGWKIMAITEGGLILKVMQVFCSCTGSELRHSQDYYVRA